MLINKLIVSYNFKHDHMVEEKKETKEELTARLGAEY